MKTRKNVEAGKPFTDLRHLWYRAMDGALVVQSRGTKSRRRLVR